MSHRHKSGKSNTKYVFYFDESHKTDVIHISDDGRINIRSPRESDTSVGAFIGIPEEGLREFEESFIRLEKATKHRIGMKPDAELKATTFKKHHFDHGIASFNGAMVEFYTGLFVLLLRKKAVRPERKNSASNGRIMEAKTVAGRVIFISRVLIGLEDSAGRSRSRTARKPTPMSRNNPIRLEHKTARFV